MMCSSALRRIPLAVMLLLPLAAAPEVAAAEQETIVFMRHGEKPPSDLGQLDCQGLNRALALPQVLISRYGKAALIFAPNPAHEVEDKGTQYNYIRPLATIEPTAILLGLPVDTRFGYEQTDELAHELVAAPHHTAVIFVAWEHKKLVDAMRKLVAQAGGNASIVPDWPDPKDFDSLFVLTLTWQSDKASIAFTHEKEGLDNRSTSCP